jgi:23S rRNA pseudouridine1911/1915/1917 synthase
MREAPHEAIAITPEIAGQTLAAVVRAYRPGQSWKQVRQFIAGRLVQINGELCLDPARRVKEGETITLLTKPAKLPAAYREELNIRHLDEHVVVVEKPSGINTVRHPAELHWKQERRSLSPTLQDRVQQALAARFNKPVAKLPRLRIVHRIDKETSGLVVFARTPLAERELGRQFHAHTVVRRYLALVPGYLSPQTIRSSLVRDRGDGRRGSSEAPGQGKEAVTHIDVVERLPGFTLLSCRLETGRTHQIRIHLAEASHPVCGEKVYTKRRDGSEMSSTGDCPRLFLHAAELGFKHPATGKEMHWLMPLPPDLEAVLAPLRRTPGVSPRVSSRHPPA